VLLRIYVSCLEGQDQIAKRCNRRGAEERWLIFGMYSAQPLAVSR
jgi:hypothetical protein